MVFFSIFRRIHDDVDNESNNNNNAINVKNYHSNNPKWRRCWRRNSDNDDYDSTLCFEKFCNIRVFTIFLHVFNMGMIMVLLITGISTWEDEWKHWVPSCWLSVMGIMGSLRENLTLTYISTIGFAIMAFAYGMMMYTIGVIVCCFIAVSQTLLIHEMLEGMVTKQDDVLLNKENQEVIKAATSFTTNAV
jgi:hypothetical protein